MDLQFKTFEKQRQALRALRDISTNEVLYGGGARGGKSWLGCGWVIMECISKPGSAWLIAREELTKLRDTTLLTFFKVLKELGLKKDIHFHYDAQAFVATFYTGSRVFFREIKYIPSDPEFDRLGSYDLTGCFLDECQQIHDKAISVLRGRFSVLSGEGWKTIPKSLYTCNPAKNWIYRDFVKPAKAGTITPDRVFIPSLATDNPFADQAYIDNLKKADKITRARLLYGDFEYDDDPAALMSIDKINDVFTNNFLPGGDKYITADIARFGKDSTTIVYWDGLRAERIAQLRKKATTAVSDMIQGMRKMYHVPMSRVVIDEDGVGCLNETTEVLTVEGWKLSTDIREGDVLVSKDPEGFREESMVAKVIHHECERFIKVNDKIEFTESHYHFYKTRKEHPMRGGYWDAITELSNIYHDTHVRCDESIPIVNFPATVYEMPNGGLKTLDNEINTIRINLSKFLGWFLSEGHLDDWNNKYVIGITQSKGSPDNDSIVSCLNDLGAKWGKKKSGQGRTWIYYIQQRDLYGWLKQNCYTDPNNTECYTKKLPDYLKRCGRDEFMSFAKEFIRGDGYYHKGAMQFVSCSERLIDDIQEGLFMVGIKSRKHIKAAAGTTGKIGDRVITRTTNIYLLSEIFKNSALKINTVTERFGKAINIKLSNKTKVMLVRQGKEVFWTHNGGVVDQLDGCYGFVNNATPLNGENFANLKSQCYFKLAELVNANQIYVNCPDPTIKQQLTEEMEQVKQKDMDKDGKKAVIPKDKVKELIGRSPDLSDSLMMRMVFEIEPVAEFWVL